MKRLNIQNKLSLLQKSFLQHIKNDNSVATMNINKGGFKRPILIVKVWLGLFLKFN